MKTELLFAGDDLYGPISNRIKELTEKSKGRDEGFSFKQYGYKYWHNDLWS